MLNYYKSLRVIIILLITMFLSNQSISQIIYTKELEWSCNDSISEPFFKSKSEIVEWSKQSNTFAQIRTENLIIEKTNFFIVMTNVCSGIYCPLIYVFREKESVWYITRSSFARLSDILVINIDSDTKKVIFKTKTQIVSEVPFKEFLR